ncbi:hypothetical protein ACFU8I_32100 [Streptomyces sp. NPDC057540]|uniref:hypothetical protein n=1 Tax=Streptomyces sp. NPDC057540 TaxID=3346160 RepID=UPI0036CC1D03
MRKKHVRKMLRQMESGETVELTLMTTMGGLTRLAFLAEQFGYAYADLNDAGGKMALLLVPDPSPQARACAAENRARYPRAADGGSLPPLVPEAIEILKARMVLDLGRKHSPRQQLAFIVVLLILGAVDLGADFGEGTVDALTIAGVFLLAMAVLTSVMFVISRRLNVTYTARLEAAGFTPVTDENGRKRYLPPGGQLPGHGNPFAT